MKMNIPPHPLEVVLGFRYTFKNEFMGNIDAEKVGENEKQTSESEADSPLDADSFKLLAGISGFVLHAAHDIPKFQCLLEYTGIVRDGELANRHSVPLTTGKFIDSSNSGNISRFASYDCDPNCYFVEKWIDEECRIFLYTLRMVKKGEALTFNFFYNYQEDEVTMKCICHSKKCDGVIGRIGQKGFNCGICGKRFGKKGNFLDHLNTHDKNRPTFQCPNCSRSYVDQRGLSRHIKIHHTTQSATFKCAVCNRTYLRKYTLDAHVRQTKHRQHHH